VANEADHISLANKNHAALTLLLSDHEQHPEWIATIAFYEAVHVVEAVFHHQSKHDSRNHDERRDRLKPRVAPCSPKAHKAYPGLCCATLSGYFDATTKSAERDTWQKRPQFRMKPGVSPAKNA